MENNVIQIFDIMNAKEHNDTSKSLVYRVPLYQRGYRWGIGQVISLLDDIHRNSMKYADKLKTSEQKATGYEYCIQPLVLRKDDESDNKKQYIVIDGQQRLTTLSLVFQALNQLENDLGYGNNSDNKRDNITIIYDRTKPDDINEISEKCSDINEISKKCSQLLKNINISCSDMKTLPMYVKSIEQHKSQINELINKQENIDYQFMINNYIYIYLFFESIIQQNSPCEYFSYLKNETRQNMDYGKQRLAQLRNIFKYELSIIWYEPDNKDEEGTFEKFNASKIPLTQSELIKALFMNPDNYIMPGSSDYSYEAIKVRQVSIGIEWDKIERSLNQADLWFFIPHNDKHNNSKFDAIVDMLVFYKMLDDGNSKREWEKNIDDDYYAYNKLEMWIREELDEVDSSEKKTNIMECWWRKLTDLYEWYYDIYESVIYESETEEAKISYAIYHRISLLQLIQKYHFSKITRGNKMEKYVDAIKKNHEIYVSLNKVSFNQYKNQLNGMIIDKINAIWETNNPVTCFKNDSDKEKADTLEKKIKALRYDSNDILMRVFQVIFSLAILEKTVGSFSRFSFREFSKKKKNGDESWVLEHIFAKGTNFENYPQKDKILSLLENSDWQKYLKYKYEDILDDSVIQKMIEAKNKVIEKIKKKEIEKKEIEIEKKKIEIEKKEIEIEKKEIEIEKKEKEIEKKEKEIEKKEKEIEKKEIEIEKKEKKIWHSASDYDADYEDTPDDVSEAMIVNFLKDNSMGNISILQYDDNSGVGNKLYLDKQKLVRDYASKGKFIPIGTLNVFNGVYTDKDFDMDVWYPIHRIKYLEAIIKKINYYLRIE